MRFEPESRKPLVVELLGMPGAGKTTVATQLVEVLGNCGVRADTITTAGRGYVRRSRLGRVLIGSVNPGRRFPRAGRALEWGLFVACGAVHSARFATEQPAFARDVVVGQCRRELPMTRRLQIIRSFARLCGRHRCLATATSLTDVLVVDDGFLHRAVELHASGSALADLELVGHYLDAVPSPDLVILVEASRCTCERRVRDRGVWRHSRDLTSAQLSTYFRGAEAVITTVAARGAALGWRVVRVDNEDGSFEDLRNTLDELVHAEHGSVATAATPAQVPA